MKYYAVIKCDLLDHLVTWENDPDILISKKDQITEQYCINPYFVKKENIINFLNSVF